MSGRRPFAGAFVAILVATLLSLCASLARADGPAPVAPASPAPAAPAEAPSLKKKLTADELEAQLLDPANRGAAISMVGLKYATALAGLVILVLRLVRWSEERKGYVARARLDAIPPRAFGLQAAIGLSIFAALGGGLLVVPLYRALAPGADAKSLPLEVQLGATAAGMIPVALAIAYGLGRAWEARRAASAATGLGEATLLPPTPWPVPARWREGLLVFLLASFVVLVVSFVTAILMNVFGAPPEPQDLVMRVIEPVHPQDPWLIAAFGVLVAPITEEYVFRGLLYPAVRDGSTRWIGALVSSVLFSAVHASWTAGPALFCLALLLCWLYERTGSVWPGILVHALNNATSLLPLMLLR